MELAAWLGGALVAMLLGLALATAGSADARTPLPQCADNVDNDGDGRIDFPFEPGCTSLSDATELNPATLVACGNGVDDDGDGRGEFPTDPGCTSAGNDPNENNPSTLPVCANTGDDDGDGKRDFVAFGAFPVDPGCSWAAESSEVDTACSDGIDNDGDGKTDFPADFGCGVSVGSTTPAVNDTSEVDPPQCDDGRDNDGDGNVDIGSDPDCSSAADNSEAPPPQCADGVDNDGDGATDFPADLGCTFSGDNDEANPACSDGLDNDGDGKVDLADQGCSSSSDDDETDTQVVYVLPPGNLGSSSATTAPKTTPLLTPFPIVRLRGRVDGRGVRVTLLTVRAPPMSKVSVYCSGPSCPRRRVAVKAGRKLVRVRQFERRLRGGTVLKVYVTKPGYVGKYTRFRFINNRVPLRVDRCARTPGTKPRACPTS